MINKINQHLFENYRFLQLMANFFIQTDKEFYFAGETVNGNIFVNVGVPIVGARGLTLVFVGYQCTKWAEAQELHRPQPPHHIPGHPPPPPPYDPIAHIPPHELCDKDDLGISDCEAEENMDFSNRRPRYIRTSANRYYRMSYQETRSHFTRNETMIYQCNTFAPGQYSFPFSFKTFEGWPASFSHYTNTKKGVISYTLKARIESNSNNFALQGSRQIILRQTRFVQSQQTESNGQITSCCCMNKGVTMSRMSFAKDGYSPGQLVQMLIQIDNTRCQANITSIVINVTNVVSLRSGNGRGTSDSRTLFSKTVNGVLAGMAYTGEKAIREQFMMPNNPQIKPTCSGKLLSSNYRLGITLRHDISCQCCSKVIGSSIDIIIFPLIPVYPMPAVFQTNWSPQIMPAATLVLPNNFMNANLGAMINGPPMM